MNTGPTSPNEGSQQGGNPVQTSVTPPPQVQPTQPSVQPVARQYMQLPLAATQTFPRITHLVCARPGFTITNGSLQAPDELLARCPQAQVLFLDRCNPQHPGTLFACSSLVPFNETVRAEYLQNTQAYRRIYGRGREPVVMITRAPR